MRERDYDHFLNPIRELPWVAKAEFISSQDKWGLDGTLQVMASGKKHEFLVAIKKSFLDRVVLNALIGAAQRVKYLRQSRRLDFVSRSKRPTHEPLKVARFFSPFAGICHKH